MQVQATSSQAESSPQQNVPIHVAIIMDGNGRWAKKRGLPRLEGHRVGVDCIQSLLETLSAKGVRYVTLYAFSTENWNRPEDEVQGILEILYDALRVQTQALHENNVRIVHIGKRGRLSPKLQEAMVYAQELTRGNTGITFKIIHSGLFSEPLNASTTLRRLEIFLRLASEVVSRIAIRRSDANWSISMSLSS